jgi:hypothetical protein
MKPSLRAAAAAAALATLALDACSTVQGYDAAGDVHAFLIAVRDSDKATFDAHVDRPALKTQLKARLLEQAGKGDQGGARGALAALAAGPLVNLGVDVLVQPQVFRAAATLAGYGPDTPIPPRIAIAHQLKTLPGDRVCVILKKRCSFVFKDEDGTWRLIGYEGDLGDLRRKVKL